MKHTVRMDSRARKTLDRLPGDMYGRVIRKLDALEENPRPFGVEKLAGPEDLYRVRVGDWRIVYAIRDRELVVIVIRIGHRREVYR
ncbi:MAG: type II toxin-antitoxin system RelE/ParE family toxin [Verrucomicrobiota bacterium]|nr:type II toxin-antitoxin system RelE/ParE family toxin [Verrucomicrobiota bacterium]